MPLVVPPGTVKSRRPEVATSRSSLSAMESGDHLSSSWQQQQRDRSQLSARHWGLPGPVIPLQLPADTETDELVQAPPRTCDDYEAYLRLPALGSFWTRRDWPGWQSEPLLRPALQGLELNFRLILQVLGDPRPYVDQEEWLRRLEACAGMQLEIIALICEGDEQAPLLKAEQPRDTRWGLEAADGVKGRPSPSSQEHTQRQWSGRSLGGGAQVEPSRWHSLGEPHTPAWEQLKGGQGQAQSANQFVREALPPPPVVGSKLSLLPQLAQHRRAEKVVARLRRQLDFHMAEVPFSMGLGETNVAGKPLLDYDAICLPLGVFRCREDAEEHSESHMLLTAHQIMEAWLVVAEGFVHEVRARVVEDRDLRGAARCSRLIERIWKFLAEDLDLLQLADPADVLSLWNRLASGYGSDGAMPAHSMSDRQQSASTSSHYRAQQPSSSVDFLAWGSSAPFTATDSSSSLSGRSGAGCSSSSSGAHSGGVSTGGGGVADTGWAFCLRSRALHRVTWKCKELKHLVPAVVGVEPDPSGGPRLQEAIQEMFHTHEKRFQQKSQVSQGGGHSGHSELGSAWQREKSQYAHSNREGDPRQRRMNVHLGAAALADEHAKTGGVGAGADTIHLLQAFQAIEVAIKRFYFSNEQLALAVAGSGEHRGAVVSAAPIGVALSRRYFEPPYFPSLDGAKTFLGACSY